MKEQQGNTQSCSREKQSDADVCLEFVDSILRTEKPSEYLRSIRLNGSLAYLPELEALVGVPQNPNFHPEGDVWSHTLLVADEASFLLDLLNIEGDMRKIIMIAVVCHDFGKALKTHSIFGRIISYGHEKAGAKPALRFLERLQLDSAVSERIIRLVENHHIPFSFYRSEVQRRERISRRALVKCITRLLPSTIGELLLVAEADYCGRAIDYEYLDYKGVKKKKYLPGEWFVEKLKENGFTDQLSCSYLAGS